MYPAGAKAESVRRVHKVAHHEAAVLPDKAAVGSCENDDHRGRAVKRVTVIAVSPSGRVELGEQRNRLRILHGDHYGGLHIAA